MRVFLILSAFCAIGSTAYAEDYRIVGNPLIPSELMTYIKPVLFRHPTRTDQLFRNPRANWNDAVVRFDECEIREPGSCRPIECPTTFGELWRATKLFQDEVRRRADDRRTLGNQLGGNGNMSLVAATEMLTVINWYLGFAMGENVNELKRELSVRMADATTALAALFERYDVRCSPGG